MKALNTEVLLLIDNYHNKTNGSCGLSMVAIKNHLSITTEELKPILRQLYDAKQIAVREGINNKLIFKI